MKNEKVLAVRGKPRWKNENLKNWQSEVSPGKRKNENLKNWQSEVSPGKWKNENLKNW